MSRQDLTPEEMHEVLVMITVALFILGCLLQFHLFPVQVGP